MRRTLYTVAVLVLVAGGPSSQAAAEDAARQTLTREAMSSEIPVEHLEKIDLAQLRSSGALKVEVNDPHMVEHLGWLFDGKTTSLARTYEVNPLIVTLTFDQPITIKALRLFPTYSAAAWAVEIAPNEDRLMFSAVPPDAWSGLELDRPVETSIVRFAVLRLQRDNHVHLNEIEIYD